MQPIEEIAHLITAHYKDPDVMYNQKDYVECPGCEKCERIQQIVAENGMKITPDDKREKMPYSRWGDTQYIEPYKEMRAMGMELSEIADELGLVLGTLHLYRQKWKKKGVIKEEHARKSKLLTEAEYRQVIEEKMTANQARAKFGVTLYGLDRSKELWGGKYEANG